VIQNHPFFSQSQIFFGPRESELEGNEQSGLWITTFNNNEPIGLYFLWGDTLSQTEENQSYKNGETPC